MGKNIFANTPLMAAVIACVLAQLLKNRRGNRIGGVALVGVVLDDDALV